MATFPLEARVDAALALEDDIASAKSWFRSVAFECAKVFNLNNQATTQARDTIQFVLKGADPKLVQVGIELAKIAHQHQNAAIKALYAMDLALELADLPDTMSLRARLTPNVFSLQA